MTNGKTLFCQDVFMHTRKNKVIYTFWLVAVAFVTGIVVLNSLLDDAASHVSSGAITNVIASDSASDNNNQLELTVRKSAHVVEYAMLGFAVMGFVAYSKKIKQKTSIGFAFFYVLAVAVADEYFQSFSDRVSSTSDILLDFFGALLGFGLVFAVFLIIKLSTKNNSEIRGSVNEREKS